MTKKIRVIDIVDEDGDLLLSIEPHWIPSGMTVEDLVIKLLPGLSDMYDYKCYYAVEKEGSNIH